MSRCWLEISLYLWTMASETFFQTYLPPGAARARPNNPVENMLANMGIQSCQGSSSRHTAAFL